MQVIQPGIFRFIGPPFTLSCSMLSVNVWVQMPFAPATDVSLLPKMTMAST